MWGIEREKVNLYTIIDLSKLLLCTLGFVFVRMILEREPGKQSMSEVITNDQINMKKCDEQYKVDILVESLLNFPLTCIFVNPKNLIKLK